MKTSEEGFDWDGLKATAALILLIFLSACFGGIGGYSLGCAHVISESELYIDAATDAVMMELDGKSFLHSFRLETR